MLIRFILRLLGKNSGNDFFHRSTSSSYRDLDWSFLENDMDQLGLRCKKGHLILSFRSLLDEEISREHLWSLRCMKCDQQLRTSPSGYFSVRRRVYEKRDTLIGCLLLLLGILFLYLCPLAPEMGEDSLSDWWFFALFLDIALLYSLLKIISPDEYVVDLSNWELSVRVPEYDWVLSDLPTDMLVFCILLDPNMNHIISKDQLGSSCSILFQQFSGGNTRLCLYFPPSRKFFDRRYRDEFTRLVHVLSESGMLIS